ncbi:MAG: hypothetical protein LBM17_07960 [Candidatus Accumulibacter sp.]|nr:hypothetical protein [Accumulibacter sp.]
MVGCFSSIFIWWRVAKRLRSLQWAFLTRHLCGLFGAFWTFVIFGFLLLTPPQKIASDFLDSLKVFSILLLPFFLWHVLWFFSTLSDASKSEAKRAGDTDGAGGGRSRGATGEGGNHSELCWDMLNTSARSEVRWDTLNAPVQPREHALREGPSRNLAAEAGNHSEKRLDSLNAPVQPREHALREGRSAPSSPPSTSAERSPVGMEICFMGFTATKKLQLERCAAEMGMVVRMRAAPGLDYLCVGQNAGFAQVTQARESGAVVVSEAQLERFWQTGSLSVGDEA